MHHRHLPHLGLPLLQGPLDVRLNGGDLTSLSQHGSLERERKFYRSTSELGEAGKLDLHDDLLLLRIADARLLSRSATV